MVVLAKKKGVILTCLFEIAQGFCRTSRKCIDLDIFCYNLSLSAFSALLLLDTKEQV
jgi:hypothetical protein